MYDLMLNQVKFWKLVVNHELWPDEKLVEIRQILRNLCLYFQDAPWLPICFDLLESQIVEFIGVRFNLRPRTQNRLKFRSFHCFPQFPKHFCSFYTLRLLAGSSFRPLTALFSCMEKCIEMALGLLDDSCINFWSKDILPNFLGR